jgi:hypothetical protein
LVDDLVGGEPSDVVPRHRYARGEDDVARVPLELARVEPVRGA